MTGAQGARGRWVGAVVAVLVGIGVLAPSALRASEMATTVYTYDALGRLATAVNTSTGVCIAYTYDANGNRTSQTITVSGAPVSPTWGTGVAGCFLWTAH